MIRVSATAIDNFFSNVRMNLLQYGSAQAYRDVAPLSWYVGTCRASAEFICALINSDAKKVAGILHKGGSYDEAIKRVKKYLKF